MTWHVTAVWVDGVTTPGGPIRAIEDAADRDSISERFARWANDGENSVCHATELRFDRQDPATGVSTHRPRSSLFPASAIRCIEHPEPTEFEQAWIDELASGQR